LEGFRRWLAVRVLKRHRPARSFDQEAASLGGVGAGRDLGLRIVPIEKIVGSVGRWQNLRSDFFYRKGDVTERFVRIGRAMMRGVDLPPIEVYKLRRKAEDADTDKDAAKSEYYVVDGHHRVAMARELGQDFLDANVKEFETRGAGGAEGPAQGLVTPEETPSEPPSRSPDVQQQT
ncbi:MAG TPA: hypothetical protein VF770_04245, partial [Solirubrobacterales bacterium]